MLGYSFEKKCGWVNMMEVFLGGNWICARDGTWRFPGIFRWILVVKCGRDFGWKILGGPRLSNLYGTVVGKWKWKGTWGMGWGFLRRLSVGPGIGEVEGCMVEKKPIDPSSAMCSMFLLEIPDVTQLGYVLLFLVGVFECTPAR